jgi:hypothetical protein
MGGDHVNQQSGNCSPFYSGQCLYLCVGDPRVCGSGSPTICQTFFSSLSSSTNVGVAPNLTVSPENFVHIDHFDTCELVFLRALVRGAGGADL